MAVTIGLAMFGCRRSDSPAETIEYKQASLQAAEVVASCLPMGVTLATKTVDQDGVMGTVEESLARLKAVPRRGKLYDFSGREVVFHKTAATGRAILNDPVYKKLVGKSTVVVLAP